MGTKGEKRIAIMSSGKANKHYYLQHISMANELITIVDDHRIEIRARAKIQI